MRGYKVTENGVEKIKVANKPLGGANVYYASKMSDKKQYYAGPQYTVVGTPTIENGIVSNFSNSSYLTLPYFADNGSDISMSISFILPDGYPNYIRALNSFGNSSSNVSFFRVLSYKGGIEFRIKNGETLTINESLSNNTLYTSLISRVSNNYTLSLLDSNNETISSTTLQTNTLIANGDYAQMKLGYENRVQGAEFPGQIVLSNTFIVKDDIMFFRGNYPNWQE